MSKATSSSTGHRFGLARVARVWAVARATVYRHRDTTDVMASPRRRGPAGPCPDAELAAHIRDQILASRFHGEGYRKIWARLRAVGIRTSERRVRRLMGAHGLLAPHRAGRLKAKVHDGTIVTDRVDAMWGTDMTETITVDDGVARVFVAVDHANSELVGVHAAKSGNRFEALEPIRQGVLRHFGAIGPGVAAGLKLRHDHGSNYMSDDFQSEVAFFGIESSPSFVHEPEGNGVAERFIRTLKENLLWVQTFDTIEQLRAALHDFARRYNETWLVARHGYQTPAQVREMQLQAGKMPETALSLAA
jgi:transposase InsO family protein